MTREFAADVRRRIEHHRIALQSVEAELVSGRGRRDGDHEAARDLRLGIIALTRAQRALEEREALPYPPQKPEDLLPPELRS